MAGRAKPKCKAKLRDGSRCRSLATTEDGHCGGCARKLREASETVAVVEDPEPEAEPEAEPEPDAVDRPGVADVRQALRDDASTGYDDLRAFFQGAMGAEKETFFTCPKCTKRNPVVIPDWTARTAAIRLLLEQGYGRAPIEPSAGAGSSKLGALLDALTDDEFKALNVGSYGILWPGANWCSYFQDEIAEKRGFLDEIERELLAGNVFMPGKGWLAEEDVDLGELVSLVEKLDPDETVGGTYYRHLRDKLRRERGR